MRYQVHLEEEQRIAYHARCGIPHVVRITGPLLNPEYNTYENDGSESVSQRMIEGEFFISEGEVDIYKKTKQVMLETEGCISANRRQHGCLCAAAAASWFSYSAED